MKCTRCKGKGIMPYPHVKEGECFRCKGSGEEPKNAHEQQLNRFRARAIEQGWACYSKGTEVLVKTNHQLFFTMSGDKLSEQAAKKLAWKIHFSGVDVTHFNDSEYWTNTTQVPEEKKEAQHVNQD